MFNLMQKCRGSISIFLCLVLLPMVTYSTMIIDASRLQSSKTQLQSAGDLTMNAAMSEYEQILQDMYGLFANAQSESQLKPALENYFYETISGSINSDQPENEYTRALAKQLTDVIFTDGMTDADVTNFMRMKLDAFTYQPVPESCVSNPMIMKSQIKDYMKYKGPVSLASNLMTKIGFMKDSKNQVDAAKEKVNYVKKVSELGDPMKAAWEAIEGKDTNNDGVLDDGYNIYGKQYADNHYDQKQVVWDKLRKSSDDVCYIADAVLLAKAHYNHMHDLFGGDISASKLNVDAYSSSFSVSGINTNVTTVDQAVGVLDQIDQLFRSKVFNYEYKTGDQLSSMEQRYGQITATYDQNNPVNVTAISFANGPDLGAGSYYATYGNLERMEQELRQSYLSDSFLNYYDDCMVIIDHADELAEYQAYYEYFKKLKEEYFEVFDKFTSSLVSRSDYSTYAKTYNLMSMLGANWESSSNYQKFKSVLNEAANTDYYMIVSSKHDDPTLPFRTYYELVSNLERTSNDACTALDKLIEKIGEAESAQLVWDEKIDTVEDSSTKSQMKSDMNSLSEGVKKSDVEALKGVMDEIHTKMSTLKGEIEAVKFAGITLCNTKIDYFSLYGNDQIDPGDTYYPSSSTLLGKISLGNLMEYDSLVKQYNDSYVYDNQITDSVTGTELIDGKDGTSSAEPKPERAEEVFYYVLKNTYGVKAPGLSTTQPDDDTKSDSQMLQTINNDSSVDENGQPSSSDAKVPETTSSGGGGNDDEAAQSCESGSSDLVGSFYGTIVGSNKPSTDTSSGYGDASSSSIPTGDDADYNSCADTGSSNLDAAGGFFDDLKNIGTSLRDDVYLEEYFTEMFTCQTDKKLKPGELKLINGYSNIATASGRFKPLNMNNSWYGKEIEYILWGNSDLDSNLRTTEALIFVIRFGLNAIYAFTASDIQQFANSIATALVGWSVVLVPVVQVCITLGVALAESAYDLALLKNGDDVPIIKNKDTFVCSPAGALAKVSKKIIEEASEKIVDSIESKLDETIENAKAAGHKYISDCKSEVDEYVSNYTEKLQISVESAIEDQFITPLINSVTPAISRLDDTKSNAEELVSEALDDVWDDIGENIRNMNGGEGTIHDLTLQFYENQGSGLKEDLKNQIIAKVKDVGYSPDDLHDIITKKIRESIDGFRMTINTKVQEITSKMSDEIMSHGDEAVDNLKSYLNEQIENVSSEVTGKITDTVTSTISSHASNIVNQSDKSASGGITLNYKEYCKIFMFIKLVSDEGETACLQRSAALIQANVRYAAENRNENFDITKAYTIFYVGAKVKMNTFFPWAVSVDVDDTDSNSGTHLDLSDLGDNHVTINYSGINGY